MKAAVIESIGSGFTFADFDVAAPEGAEVLIDVKASGLCHTDLTFARHDLGVSMPAAFGHEVAGVVAVSGPDEPGPDEPGLCVGDHVVACNIPFCGECASGSSGRTCLCSHPSVTQRSHGHAPRLSRDGKPVSQFFGIGGFAEQVLERDMFKLSLHRPSPPPGHPCDYNSVGGRVGERAGADST